MKNFIVFLISLNLWAESGFLPNSFRANFEQKFISTVSGKEKKSNGNIDYQYSGKIRFEVVSPDPTLFVSNGIKSWYYTTPFDPKEKGEVVISDSNKLLVSKFFDYLKNGLETNNFYSVKKEVNDLVLIFNPKEVKNLGVQKAILNFGDKKNPTKLSELKLLNLVYKDGKKVNLTFSNLLENVKFDNNYFDFKIPLNTKEVKQD